MTALIYMAGDAVKAMRSVGGTHPLPSAGLGVLHVSLVLLGFLYPVLAFFAFGTWWAIVCVVTAAAAAGMAAGFARGWEGLPMLAALAAACVAWVAAASTLVYWDAL